MRTSRLAPLLAVALFGAMAFNPGSARAEADTFGLGSGRDAALVVNNPAGTVVNTYAPVTAAITAGGKAITIGARTGAAANFTAGQLVMILQTRGGFAVAPASGSAATVTLTAATKTGRYELARVASVGANSITLTHGTVNAFDANDTQIISVPEYTTVTVNVNARLTAAPWVSATGAGGVLAFLATGAVTNAGVIDASSSGLDGGVRITAPTVSQCAANDGTPGAGGAAAGGAHKGEGLDPGAFSQTNTYAGAVAHEFGRGNVTTGGGGGDCFNSGGGGGGNGGAGGHGGDTNNIADTRRAVGGSGGAPASYDPAVNLTLGGGGGAGEDDDGVGGNGGSGGGVVWMRADSLAGAGVIHADGAVGGSGGAAGNPIFTDGGGGGGAGGGVFAWLHGTATCGGITAHGGNGGNAQPVTPGRSYGPGGGGAGGRVQIAAAAGGVCVTSATSGLPGSTTLGGYGATSGTVGTTTGVAAFATTTCTPGTGQCGGCVNDTFCAAGKTCDTSADATQWTCVAKAPFGSPPSGGEMCVAGATPTQGTSPGCVSDLCDTSDGLCGYANGTTCTASAQCRSNDCGKAGKCIVGSGDAGTSDASVDGSAKDASTDAAPDGSTTTDSGLPDGGTTSDGGTSHADSGSLGADSGGGSPDDTSDQGAELEGGGCNTSGGSDASMLWLVGLFGAAVASVRRLRRKRG